MSKKTSDYIKVLNFWHFRKYVIYEFWKHIVKLFLIIYWLFRIPKLLPNVDYKFLSNDEIRNRVGYIKLFIEKFCKGYRWSICWVACLVGFTIFLNQTKHSSKKNSRNPFFLFREIFSRRVTHTHILVYVLCFICKNILMFSEIYLLFSWTLVMVLMVQMIHSGFNTVYSWSIFTMGWPVTESLPIWARERLWLWILAKMIHLERKKNFKYV